MPDLYVDGGDGWTHIGETFGDPKFEFEPKIPADLVAVRWPPDITLSITVDARPAIRTLCLLTGFTRRLIHEQAHSGSYSRCRACHPEQDRRPLAVNGREYHRRHLARQRRRRA